MMVQHPFVVWALMEHLLDYIVCHKYQKPFLPRLAIFFYLTLNVLVRVEARELVISFILSLLVSDQAEGSRFIPSSLMSMAGFTMPFIFFCIFIIYI